MTEVIGKNNSHLVHFLPLKTENIIQLLFKKLCILSLVTL